MNDSMDSGASRPTIAPRRMRFDLGSVPRYRMRGRRFATHFFNSLNALLPPTEHVFVRVCASMLAHVDDPQLARDVRGFVAQESSHASSHLRMIPHLESQGFPLRSLLERVEHRSERGDRMFGPRQQLALIAGVEHFTAILGAWAFERGVFEDADPVVRDLSLWHAAEDIERKCVAFDLLQAVRPGYWARVLGLTGALFALCAEWTWCTIRLIHRDPEVSRSRAPVSALPSHRHCLETGGRPRWLVSTPFEIPPRRLWVPKTRSSTPCPGSPSPSSDRHVFALYRLPEYRVQLLETVPLGCGANLDG